MIVDVGALVPWLALVLAAASFYYTIHNNRSKDIDRKLESVTTDLASKASNTVTAALTGKLDLLEDRTTRVETEMKHLPDHRAVSKLEGMINQLSGEVGILSERIRPVAAIAERLQEKIMESAGLDR